jgi:hypothetical protein
MNFSSISQIYFENFNFFSKKYEKDASLLKGYFGNV